MTQNVTVAGAINITTASPQVQLTSLSQGIDFNAAFNAGARNVSLAALGTSTGDGEVRQDAAAVITASVLNLIADQAITLNTAVNKVGGLPPPAMPCGPQAFNSIIHRVSLRWH